MSVNHTFTFHVGEIVQIDGAVYGTVEIAAISSRQAETYMVRWFDKNGTINKQWFEEDALLVGACKPVETP